MTTRPPLWPWLVAGALAGLAAAAGVPPWLALTCGAACALQSVKRKA